MKQFLLKLFFKVNMCDIDRLQFLAPLGDAVATLWDAFTAFTDCACCLGTRLIILTLLSFYLGTLV